jgi:hypothetical protein
LEDLGMGEDRFGSGRRRLRAVLFGAVMLIAANQTLDIVQKARDFQSARPTPTTTIVVQSPHGSQFVTGFHAPSKEGPKIEGVAELDHELLHLLEIVKGLEEREQAAAPVVSQPKRLPDPPELLHCMTAVTKTEVLLITSAGGRRAAITGPIDLSMGTVIDCGERVFRVDGLREGHLVATLAKM